MAAIDLYSGIGGWSLGLKMAGIEVVASYEWWKDANLTHNKNFGSQHRETDIRQLDLATLPARERIQYVVGSPPCTEFSYSNRGGNGDIKDGLIDIIKFLEVVEYLQPTYWAMENVPRVVKVLEKQMKGKGKLVRFKHLFGDIKIYNCADFGVPQDRKRMIAGRLPFHLLDSYKADIPQLHLGDVLASLHHSPYIDPIYGIEVAAAELTDHVREPNLNREEARINREAKVHHPVYNKMSFPDRQDRPSRTITALCTRVSRESIVIRDADENLRRLTVRERAAMQSFPLNYQFFGSTYANKLKMVGNAVPPLLTFYIAQSMLEVPLANVLRPQDVPRDRLVFGQDRATDHRPDNQGAKYSWNRSFWLAIGGLRFGSGVRFDLKNFHKKTGRSTTWRINFYYGPSKDIQKKELDREIVEKALRVTTLGENEDFIQLFREYLTFVETVDEAGLQKNWTNVDRSVTGPIDLVDTMRGYVLMFKEHLEGPQQKYADAIEKLIKAEFVKKEKEDKGKKKKEKVKGVKKKEAKPKKKKDGLETWKFTDKAVDIFIGILIGSSFNVIMNGEEIKIKKKRVRAIGA